MKEGRTLEDLAREITRQASAKRDFLAPTAQLQVGLAPAAAGVRPAVALTIPTAGENVDVRIDSHTHGQIATRLREHLKADRFKSTYDALLNNHPDLLVPLVNGLWGRYPEQRMVRTLDGRARAYLSDSYRVIDHDVVLETALQALQGSGAALEIQSAQVTERRLYLKATFPGVRAEVRVGDVVEAGVVISNSEIGEGAVSVQPLIHRLVCLNGMIAGDRLSRYHVGRARGESCFGEINYQADTIRAENSAFLLRVRDAVSTAMSQTGFEKIVERFKVAAELEIEARPAKAVEVTAERFGLNLEESDSILAHLLRGNDLSQWGLANAVTRASQDVQSFDRATELEAVGGKVIEMSPADWITVAAADLDKGGVAYARIERQATRLLAA